MLPRIWPTGDFTTTALVQSVEYVPQSKGQRSFQNGLVFDQCYH